MVATTAPESGGPTPAVREAIDTAAAAARAEGKSRGLHEDSSDMNDLIFKAAVRAALEQFMPKAQLELIRDASNAAVVRHEAETAAAVSEGKKEFTTARPLPTYTLGSVQRLVAFMVYTGIVRLPSLELYFATSTYGGAFTPEFAAKTWGGRVQVEQPLRFLRIKRRPVTAAAGAAAGSGGANDESADRSSYTSATDTEPLFAIF